MKTTKKMSGGNLLSKIAIGVVLIPDKTMTDYAIKINRQLIKIFNNKRIVLNRIKCLPHISIAMGVIKKDSLPKINKILQDISSNLNIFKLRAISYHGVKIGSGDVFRHFTIKNISALQTLHESVMTKLKPFLSYNATTDMFFTPPVVESITPLLMNGYKQEGSFKKFKPHITIGFGGKLKNLSVPIVFTAPTLAICHLGNYCTCRKVLFAVKLN